MRVAPIKVEMQSTHQVSRVAAAIGTSLILDLLLAPFIVFAMAADTSAAIELGIAAVLLLASAQRLRSESVLS